MTLGVIFDSQEACAVALEQIRLNLRQDALGGGMQLTTRDGREMIVSQRCGAPDAQAVGTFVWDEPHQAEGAEHWYCASPEARHPGLLAALELEEVEIPPEWLPSPVI